MIFIWYLDFRDCDLEFWSLGFLVLGFGHGIWSSEYWVLNFCVWDFEFGCFGLIFGDWCLGLELRSLEFEFGILS